MKRLLLLLVIMLLPIVASADAVEIDGIYYNLITKGKVAEVTENPNKYSGDIVIPESVKYNDVNYCVIKIGYYAFGNCKDLTSVTIGNNVTEIGPSAFSSSSGLTTVTIPNSVITISVYAFYHCTALTAVTIPNSVTTIGDKAFAGCTSLNSIIIPNSVITIGDDAFTGCTGLTSLTIGNNVTSIGIRGFASCKSLTSLTIPNSVTSIGESAFVWCTGLTTITIPNSVSTISDSAFLGCSKLTSVNIPNSVEYIGQLAFSECTGLTSVIIGKGIKVIYNCAFAYCPEITDFYCYAEQVPAISSQTFMGSYIEYATLHVPEKLVNAYKAIEPWSSFKNIEKIIMPEYKLTYLIGSEVYKSYEIEEGATITPEAEPTKEGFTFSGWSEIPATMPAHDVTVNGSFIVNKYKVTYIIGNEVFSTEYVEYGAAIVPPNVDEKEGFTFSGWADVPETMPAHDITIYGSFTSGITEIMMAAQSNVHIYSPNGKKIDRLQKGLNIIVLADGTVKKIVVK